MSPAPIRGPTVIVSVGVVHDEDVPVELLDQVLVLRSQIDRQLVDEVRDGGGGDPLPGVGAAVQVHRRLVAAPSPADLEQLLLAPLPRVADHLLTDVVAEAFYKSWHHND